MVRDNTPKGPYIGKEDKFWSRLRKNIEDGIDELAPFRKQRNEALGIYAGSYYGPQQSGQKAQIINEIFGAVSVFVPMLVARNPHCRVTTPIFQLRPMAWMQEKAGNHLLREIDFVTTVRRAVTASLFGVGIIKTGLGPGKQAELEHGFLADMGQPFAANVDEDDWFHDPLARVFEECFFMGNTWRAPVWWVRESGLYENTDTIDRESVDAYSGKAKDAKSHELSGRKENMERVYPHCKLYDVWLPQEQLYVTLPSAGQGDKPLRIVAWEGPEEGPYDMLHYHELPNNVMPVPPVAAWRDLHTLINVMTRKLKRQANREKIIMAYERRAADDAKAIMNANDGEVIQVNDINRIKEIKFGGATPEAYTFIQWLSQVFSKQAGNVDLAGGRAAGSKTLGQDLLLQANTDVQIGDMTGRVQRVITRVCRKLHWYLFHDPLIKLPMTHRVKGALTEIEVVYTPDAREGDFFDFMFDIVPYSMTEDNPEKHMQKLMMLLGNVILPTAQMAAMQGSMLNVDALVQRVAKELGIEEIDELYIPGGQMPTSQPGGVQPPAGPPQGQQAGGNRIVVNTGSVATPGMGAAPSQMGARNQSQGANAPLPGGQPSFGAAPMPMEQR